MSNDRKRYCYKCRHPYFFTPSLLNRDRTCPKCGTVSRVAGKITEEGFYGVDIHHTFRITNNSPSDLTGDDEMIQ